MAELDVAVVWSDAEHLPVDKWIGRRAGTKEVAPVVLWIQVFASEGEMDDQPRLGQAHRILRFLRSDRVTLFPSRLERCEGRFQVRVRLMATRRARRARRARRVVRRRVVELENERVGGPGQPAGCWRTRPGRRVMVILYRHQGNRTSFRHSLKMPFLDCMMAMRYVMRRYDGGRHRSKR
jgi:hypothetical protein